MYKKLTGIPSPKDGDILWRYLSFEKFASLLSTKSLYFVRADQFEDPFEGRVPQLILEQYVQKAKRLGKKESQAVIELWEDWRKWVMCSCWHHGDHELMAMWERERYGRYNSGITIKTTMERLKTSLTYEEGIDVYIGKVRYINYQDFDPPNVLRMSTIYSPFFFKRKAFKCENEVRAIIDDSPYRKEDFFRVKKDFSLKPQEFDLKTLQKRIKHLKKNENKGQPLCVDLNTLIDEVIVAPRAPHWVIKAIRSMVHQYGFDFEVNPSILLDEPSEIGKS
ncbi:MAG: hypothetical protein OYL97_24160 [Candidatus Poribacteria bacterium]|nr:hypothetical protein [Candidatus Poribacteria bacterium]